MNESQFNDVILLLGALGVVIIAAAVMILNRKK